MVRAPQRSTAATRPRRMAAPSASSASRRAKSAARRRHLVPLPDKVDVPSTESERPTQPSGLGQVPESAASGSTVKIGLSAKTGPTIEMSPRALARARSPLIPMTSTAHTATAGQANLGSANAWPVTRKNAAQLAAAIACVQVTITSGGMPSRGPSRGRTGWPGSAPRRTTARTNSREGLRARGAPGAPRAHAPGRRRYNTSEVSDITASPPGSGRAPRS